MNNTLLTKEEVAVFKSAGFVIEKETVIKSSETINDLDQLSKANSFDEVKLVPIKNNNMTFFNVRDKKGELILMEIESTRDLFYQIRRLISDLL